MAHWIEENERDRKKFWATARDAGLDHAAVHELFDVESMKDYVGTLVEALATVKEEKERLKKEEERQRSLAFAAECAHLPESPAVVWTKFQSKLGFVWSLTFRAGLTPESEREALSQLRRQVELFEAGAEKLNWLPVANGHDVTATPAPPQQKPARPGQSPPPGGSAPPATPSVAGSGGNGGALSFEAQSLAATISDGKVYWRIKGGRFSKHGVNIWPEVLEASGWDPDGLDPTTTYNVTGYTAHYVLNDKGNPGKVTKLDKAGVTQSPPPGENDTP